jgi:hypothetical protein
VDTLLVFVSCYIKGGKVDGRKDDFWREEGKKNISGQPVDIDRTLFKWQSLSNLSVSACWRKLIHKFKMLELNVWKRGLIAGSWNAPLHFNFEFGFWIYGNNLKASRKWDCYGVLRFDIASNIQDYMENAGVDRVSISRLELHFVA